jgi:hypothetical protein
MYSMRIEEDAAVGKFTTMVPPKNLMVDGGPWFSLSN